MTGVQTCALPILNLLAVRFSLTSADREHPFGHGKAEYLAGLGQSLFIGFSAIFVISQALDRFLHPRPLSAVGAGIGVMVAAILVTLALVIFQRRVVAKTGSTAIRADSLHYASDLFTNLGTILALVLAGLGWSGLDPLIAVIIALAVLYNAWQIAWVSAQMLLDRHLPSETEGEIARLALAHEQVQGVHDIRTRRSGQTHIIQLHLELAGDLPLVEAHRVAKEVEVQIREIVPQADIIIHQDPINK